MFCGYRIWNKQFTRKKVLLSAWIRRECRAKPLANEFKGLMHLNSCLFKFPHSNIHINLKEADIFHCSCFTWNIILVKCFDSAVVSRETKRCGILDNKPSGVSRETNLSNSIFFNKTERNKGFLIRKPGLSQDFEN